MLTGKPQRADLAFRWASTAAAALVLIILGAITVVMASRAAPTLGNMGLSFVTSSRWSEADHVYGALPLIWGTLYTSALAIVFAVPVSVGVALYITQVAPTRLRRPLIYLLDLLAVVPSVVFGLWGFLVLVPHLGQSYLTAGLILAIMITPIITSLAREVIETTPTNEKEAAFGLGATRWEMITGAVWPHSKSGLVGAVMLGLGRAMGETIAVTLVLGTGTALGVSPLAIGNSMPAQIARLWGEAHDEEKSALAALALLLFVITIVVNLVATAIVRRSVARSRGR